MILGVDVGGTKTLIAGYADDAKTPDYPLFEEKIITPDTYQQLLEILPKYAIEINNSALTAIGIALPGAVSDDGRSVARLGNQSWTDMNVVDDLEKLFSVPVALGNDAKLAALGEANHGAGVGYKSVVYATISTGIGVGLCYDGNLVETALKSEPGMMTFIKNGEPIAWEDFASGRALVERFGKSADELNDNQAWREFSLDLALGLSHVVQCYAPDLVLLGGHVGQNLHKFADYLDDSLNNYLHTKKMVVAMPKIISAQFPNKCVIRGCFYAAKQLT